MPIIFVRVYPEILKNAVFGILSFWLSE